MPIIFLTGRNELCRLRKRRTEKKVVLYIYMVRFTFGKTLALPVLCRAKILLGRFGYVIHQNTCFLQALLVLYQIAQIFQAPVCILFTVAAVAMQATNNNKIL